MARYTSSSEFSGVLFDILSGKFTSFSLFFASRRDKTEPVKKLTTEERMEISKKENPVSTTSTYSPRRERGLKIYLDSSPKKRDDY